MGIKVLVADDEPNFRGLVSDFLQNAGLEVVEASNGEEALSLLFENNDIDLVILDVMMPIYDGWEVLSEIRKELDIPVIMLTALGDEKNEVYGLNKGADEYISKPFSYEVFMARVNAIVRKIKQEQEEEIVVKELRIDQKNHRVTVRNNKIELSPKEYKLLIYLLKNKGRILSRDQILDAIWGYNFYGDRRTVDTHIKTLRAKLKEYGRFIKTVRGIGYKIEVK